MPRVTVLAESCKGVEDCGLCMEVCPENLFTSAEVANARGYLPADVADVASCTSCDACMRICPDFAVIVTKDKKSKGANHG